MALLRDAGDDFASAIDNAAQTLGLAPTFVEKDYWVTQVLRELHVRYPGGFVFKGGTSLSKGYGLIDRFSEDVDILVLPAKDDSARARETLLASISIDVAEALNMDLTEKRPPGRGRAAHRADVLAHPKVTSSAIATPFENRGVLLETGFAGGDWPSEMVTLEPMLCGPLGLDPAEYEDTERFVVRALRPERTLLEKLSLLHHVASEFGAKKSDDARCGRHYYDVYRLLDHRPTRSALSDRAQFHITLSHMETVSKHYGGWTAPSRGRLRQQSRLLAPRRIRPTGLVGAAIHGRGGPPPRQDDWRLANLRTSAGSNRRTREASLTVRVCIVYDCLYPHTVGGAERWYRELALELAGTGHEVTYLTRKQWEDGESPDPPGVKVVAVSPGGPLYTEDGRRTIGPPLRFGLGVLKHLLRNRGSYDAVHLCSFPYFSLLATRLALAGTPARIGVDWFEVWTLDYWRGYLGRVGGRIGWAVQRLCARLTPQAFVFSNVHAERLQGEGLRRPAVRLAGLYRGPLEPHAESGERAPLVVFAGRHIPEKRAELLPAAVAAARREIPELRGIVLGDGPERERVLAAIDAAGVADAVDAPGFVAVEEVGAALSRAACMLLPSSREGYGMVVIEAAALGTPSVVIAGDDNAAAELIDEGVNGFVAPSADPDAIAAAIAACVDGGAELRERTAAWFAENAPQLTVDSSARAVDDWYSRSA